MSCEFATQAVPTTAPPSTPPASKHHCRPEIEGYPVEGVSIGGKLTCVIFLTLSLAFDIGLGPQRAFAQEFLFLSHGRLDHIGGLPLYVAAREFLRLRPPTVFIPACLRDLVERLFEVYRSMSRTELKYNLVPLEIGEEYQFRRDLKVRAFKTYHIIPSQGYVIYTMKQKLKQEFIGLPGSEIKRLRLSGVEVTNTVSTPEIAFTGDTTSDFILDPHNSDVLAAKILVAETTFLDDSFSVEHAREYGHTHLSELASQSETPGNKAILLIHFSACYTPEDQDARQFSSIALLYPNFIHIHLSEDQDARQFSSRKLVPMFRKYMLMFFCVFISS